MSYRVAMVGACPFPVPQGSQILLRDTALGLCARGHQVHLVTYGYGIGDDPAGLSIHRGPNLPGVRRTTAGPFAAKPFLDLALVATLRRVVREQDLHIVHAHNYEGLLVALTARRRPIVYHAHNALADELPYYARGAAWTASVGARLDRALPRRADHVIVPHARLAEYLIGCGCVPERMSVIPPPVDAADFEPAVVEQAVPPILYTGNLDAYQNLGLLERVVARLRGRRKDLRFQIATAHPVANIPGAEIVPTPDLAALREALRPDSVVACPRVSWSGYPIKLLNAMAAGKAIVACQSAAHPLISEQNGLVVPDNDEEAFAEALERLLDASALREGLGRRARETVTAANAPGLVAEKVEAVYKAALFRA